MNSIHVLTIHSDYNRGGAAIVAKQLHETFNTPNTGITSHLLTPNKNIILNKNLSHLGIGQFNFLANVFLYRLGLGEGYLNKFQWEKFFKEMNGKYKIIHLHNAHGYYLPHPILKQITKEPLVWTLHDFWLLTGRCASPINCTDYLHKCKPCPLKNRYPSVWFDSAHKMYNKKLEILKNKNIKFVVPSYFMLKHAIKMGLPKDQVRVIYNPIVNSNEVSKKTARKILNLHMDEYLGIFISNKLDNPEKGLKFLLSVLKELLHITKWRFLFIGHCNKITRNLIQESIGSRATIIGFITDRQLLNRYMLASNAFVNPTYTETFGLINVEAVFAGCNVITNDLPVIRETIGSLGTYFKNDNKQELYTILKNLFINSNPQSDIIHTDYLKELQEKFSIKTAMEKYKICYEEAIQ